MLVGRRSFRETVMNALGARGHLIYARTQHGCFFIDPSDRGVGTELVWGRGEWQATEVVRAFELLRDLGRLPPAPVFVDVGANVGTETVYALHAGFARAVAFEPEPRNAALLRMNIESNGLRDRTTIVQKAAGATAGPAVLHLHPRNKGNHMIGVAPSRDATEQVDVEVVRAEAVLSELGMLPADVGLLWIDAEGLEPQVIAGLGSYVRSAVPLAMEYSPLRYTASDREHLLRTLCDHYRFFMLLDGSDHRQRKVSSLDGIESPHTDVLLW